MNRDVLRSIIDKTANLLKRELSPDEARKLSKFVKSSNIPVTANNVDKIVKSFYSKLVYKEPAFRDGHDVMLEQLSKGYTAPQAGSMQSSDVVLSSVKMPGPTVAQHDVITIDDERTVTVFCDSKYRNLSTPPDVFSWTISSDISHAQGTANVLFDMSNITSVRIDNFTIPYHSSADNIYRKISILIDELTGVAIVMGNGQRYHIMLDTVDSKSRISLLCSRYDDGIFYFENPIKRLDTISMRFCSPFSPIVFLQDRFNVHIEPHDNKTLITFNTAHQMADQELIYISEFTTLSTNVDDAVINEVNRAAGHIATILNNTQIQITVNINNITQNPNNVAVCFIASRRVFIPVCFTYKHIKN
jgi:hypothetical protein